MSNETEEKIEFKEEADGSVVVDLPDNIPAPEQEESVNDVADDLADADDDEDTEALRNAKRERRRAKRELARKTSAEKDQRLQLLQRQNEELMQRLSVVERKTHAGEIAKIDRTIEDYQLRLEYAKRKLGEATAAGDADASIQAQEMWYESRQQLEALQNLKKAASQPKQQNNLPNPEVQKMAASWIKRNDWYDVNHRDTDSKIAKQIDEELTAQGWNPASEDYWDELDARLHKYLPHRYNSGGSSVRSNRPRNMQASAGRETSSSGGRNAFVLTPDQVKAMKDAGFWDDPQKRNRMIKRYAEDARKNQGYRN